MSHGHVMWVSREAAFRPTDDWKDTTMPSAISPPKAVLGIDVGKSSHWACLVTREGEVALNRRVRNSEGDLDGLFSQVACDTIVVVDQCRNIGLLAISRARLAGLGIPDALLPVPEPDESLEAARSLAAQRSHMVTCATRDKNRLRSILLESCPAFEALADLGNRHWLNMLEKLGGPWGCIDAGKPAFGAVTKGANRARMDAAWNAAMASTRPSKRRADAENPQVRMLARRIREALEEADRIDREITALLAGDGTYECLVTIPGIGPRTASELVIGINIEDFPDHDHLASYCGIAPRNRQSGTSISSVSASRQGNRRLKNLLIFSCNSLVRSENRFGEYYRACRGRGMCHGEALKAVARKRLKVIYAIMRDKVPYSA